MPIPPHMFAQNWGVCWNSGSQQGIKWSPCALVEAPKTHTTTPTSNPNIYKVIDNLHMHWMGIGIRHQAVTTSRFEKSAEILLVHSKAKMKLLCTGWGSKNTWHSSHIQSKHIQGNLQPSYAIDGDRDPSSSCYQQTCPPRIGKSAKSLGCFTRATNEALVPWWRLQTHMTWLPHPQQTYTRRLTTFICNGWG